jgi:molybdate transport system substrate-binding protein
MKRVAPVLVIVALAAVAAALTVRPRPAEPLVMLVAASQRPVAEQVAADFERDYGIPVELRFGGSEELVTQLKLLRGVAPADVFLPADASYLDECGPHPVVSPPLTAMTAVALTPPDRVPADFAALTAPGVRLGLASPETAAIGKLARRHLTASGRWSAVEARLAVTTDTVTQSANAVKLGALDAAIVWDATARQFAPGLVGTPLPELAGITADVRAAALAGSRRPADAAELLAFLADPAGGGRAFAAHGFPPRPERTQ